MDKGEIGTPRLISASLCYSMVGKERIMRPNLCGGALLDLGVCCLNFARMYFGGDDGYIVVDNINCPEAVKLYRDYQLVEEFKLPSSQITGYEYEVFACRDALREGRLETPQMTHRETVEIMKMMDSMRAEWGVRFPADK